TYLADIQGAQQINEGFRNNLTGRSTVETLSLFDRVPLLQKMEVDLHLYGDNELCVKNQIAAVLNLDLELQMDLKVKGYLYAHPSVAPEERLRLSGSLRTLENSRLIYANNAFEVLDGQIQFSDPLAQGGTFLRAIFEAARTFRVPRQDNSRFSLSGDVQGNMIEEEVTMRARVEMPTRESEPKIELDLNSATGRSKIEVATLVLTGRYPSQFTPSASVQPATEVLFSPILSLIERPIEDNLNLELSLTPDASGLLYVDLNSVYSRRLRLYARTPVGGTRGNTRQLFGVESRISNWLSLEFNSEDTQSLSARNLRMKLRLSWD
ncbi:MAG: translocation/assembly module TamB domain-containing protein, partial [Myxococcota bacterium]|nr:translocation/assembly module TamB domain-containing protein [Myxococcota bacterium]